VAPKIDPVNLIDAQGVAKLLGLSHRTSVSTYRRRYDFPEPIVEMGAGRCLLWLRADVEAWARSRRAGPAG
jgi:predicted DNA-binding transcriptional regulator AlpA